ncbi:WG repeat-containing protein [Domibacillus indicus]|uniref:WG repeat-containing protein n=1 Tax=Domibacillus indicus TaxID=1437523 RepID=UPI0006181922|nr:WG repeat-containing protein [Domibacillus indicus]
MELKYGFYDSKGSMKIPPKFERAECYHNGFAAVQLDGKWGLINMDGEFAIPPKFPADSYKLFKFSEGLILIQNLESQKYGFLDQQGHLKIPFQYTLFGSFMEGLLVFESENGKYGFCDKDGKVVIEPQYIGVNHGFIKGFSEVLIDGQDQWVLINKKGEIIDNSPFSREVWDEMVDKSSFDGMRYQLMPIIHNKSIVKGTLPPIEEFRHWNKIYSTKPGFGHTMVDLNWTQVNGEKAVAHVFLKGLGSEEYLKLKEKYEGKLKYTVENEGFFEDILNECLLWLYVDWRKLERLSPHTQEEFLKGISREIAAFVVYGVSTLNSFYANALKHFVPHPVLKAKRAAYATSSYDKKSSLYDDYTDVLEYNDNH